MDQKNRFTPHTIVSWHPAQSAAEIDGEVVVMGFSQGKYVGLNDIASAIWRRLERPQPVADLCDALVRDFEGAPAAIRRDVVELLGRLDELGLLTIADQASADA
jgi:hypothetical protein